MFWVALAWVAGLACGLLCPLPAWPLVAGAGVGLLMGVLRLVRSRRIQHTLEPAGRCLLLALVLLAWHAGSQVARQDALAANQRAALPAELPATIEGRVAEEPTFQPDGWQIVLRDVVATPQDLRLAPIRLRQSLSLTLRDTAAAPFTRNPHALPLPGRPLRAFGVLQPLLPPRTPTTFDHLQYWRSRQLQTRLTVARAQDVELGPASHGLWPDFLGLMRDTRLAIGELFERELPHPQANLARALVLGEVERLGLADRDAFRATGLSHLMAVSGFNTALVLLVFLGFARIAGAPPRLAMGIGMLAIAVFTALTGFEPPVLRAALMSFFVLAAFVLGRPGSTLAGLATATFVSLVIEPRNLLRIDWQLSYCCVLSLLLFTPPMLALLTRPLNIEAEHESAPPTLWRRLRYQWLWLPLAATLAVQLGMLPLQIYYFHQINLLFALANLVGIFLGSIAMVLLTIMIVLGWLPWLPIAIAWLASIAMELMIQFIRALEQAQWAQIALAGMPLVIMLLFYLIVLSGRWLRAPEADEAPNPPAQRRSLLFRLAALGVLLAWLPLVAGAPVGDLEVYFLDVGQGDAIVVRAPNGRVMLVDGGRNMPRDAGRYTVGPFLDALGIRRLDVVVATHADADHVGGLPWLLTHYDVGCVLHGPDLSTSQVFAAMRAVESARHIPVYQVQWGAALQGFGPLAVRCLGPVAGADNNNASIVLLLSYLQSQILLTGDLEAAGEQAILQAGLASDVEVLKLGHHGSKSSSSAAFLTATRPELAIISVGAKNRYGHPAPDVLHRLDHLQIPAFRTDQSGTLRLQTDGHRLELYRYAGR
jgi:competence protein ComEC